MTQYTENYNLELYEGTDKALLTDQYNVSMGILDEALKGVDTGTKAEISRLEGDLATTNSNLNATNQNAAALKKEVEDNYAQQLATDAQQQTEIDALRNANSPSGADFQALSTKVTNNTTLVEEHVNYFADLGVTDEQSAHDLHNQIDQSFQGVMSNTAAIGEIEKQLSPWHKVGVTTTDRGQHDTYVMNGMMYVVIKGNTLSLNIGKTGDYQSVAFTLPEGYSMVESLDVSPGFIWSATDNTLKKTIPFISSYSNISKKLRMMLLADVSGLGSVAANQIISFPVTYTDPTPPEPSRERTGEFVGSLIGDSQYGIAPTPPVKFTGSINPTNKTLTVKSVVPSFACDNRTPSGTEVSIDGVTISGVSGTAWKVFSDTALPSTTKTLTGSISLVVTGSQWEGTKTVPGSLVVSGGALYAVFADGAVGTLAETVNAGGTVTVNLSINATNVHYE